MKRLYVFADFDWLKAPRLIGEMSYKSIRDSDSYEFYNHLFLIWLQHYLELFLVVQVTVFFY